MKFRSRSDQTVKQISLPFYAMARAALGPVLTDAIFDTSPLPRPMRAVNWSRETQVHSGIRVTDNLRSTNQFVGTQVMLVRDEVRRTTHLIAIENDGLYHYVYLHKAIQNKRLVAPGQVRRAHISLRKYDGSPMIVYVAESAGLRRLYLNDLEIPTDGQDVDFPFYLIEQPTIGFPAITAPTNALLFYKDRASNKQYVRGIEPTTFRISGQIELPFQNTLGGADADINSHECIIRVQVQIGGALKSFITRTTDLGQTFSNPVAIDVPQIDQASELPATAPVIVDNTYNFHVPVAIASPAGAQLVDVLPNDDLAVSAVATLTLEGSSVARFPKMPTNVAGYREGFGDGMTDGSGIIASVLSSGKLLVSNSQCGGYSYPSEAHLNYEMQKAYAFRATECYTRGDQPNMVSMDYLIVESDDDGRTLSSELWIDTWDMPLPLPEVSCVFDNGVVTIRIHKDGWFFHGQSSFEITPANTFITKVTMNGFREVALEFDDPNQIPGSEISFETKNVFYHHSAKVKV